MTDGTASTDGSGGDDGPTPATAVPVRGPLDALAWGGVGALSFLVLHQAYLLAGGRFLGVAPVAGVALAVGAVVAGVTYRLGAGGPERAGGDRQRR